MLKIKRDDMFKEFINGLKWNSLSPMGVIIYVSIIMVVTVFSCIAIVV